MEFIKNLYNSDNFTLYLTIALIVLVILFFVVLIFGKKDQLEETKRLQKIETDDAFKKEEKEPVKVEVKEEKEEEKKVHVIVFEPDKSNSKSLPKEEEENLVLPEASLDEISLSIAEGINNLENIKKEFYSIEIPEIDNKEEKEKEFTPSEVFSSVYVKDEPKVTVEEPKKIEKPILINQENNANDEDDDEFALPELASDDKK